jgi:hypothetical protein
MRRRTLALAVVLGLLGTSDAWAAPAPKRKESKRPTEVQKEGKILIVRGLSGGEPQLTTEDGARFLLIGALREELLRLEGHRLQVTAVPGAKKLMMETLEVSRYEILDSGGGRKPLVGMLRKGASGLSLERPKAALIEVEASRGLLAELEKRVGCKIWILGELQGTTLKAFKFGWLSCKTPKSIKPDKENKR